MKKYLLSVVGLLITLLPLSSLAQNILPRKQYEGFLLNNEVVCTNNVDCVTPGSVCDTSLGECTSTKLFYKLNCPSALNIGSGCSYDADTKSVSINFAPYALSLDFDNDGSKEIIYQSGVTPEGYIDYNYGIGIVGRDDTTFPDVVIGSNNLLDTADQGYSVVNFNYYKGRAGNHQANDIVPNAGMIVSGECEDTYSENALCFPDQECTVDTDCEADANNPNVTSTVSTCDTATTKCTRVCSEQSHPSVKGTACNSADACRVPSCDMSFFAKSKGMGMSLTATPPREFFGNRFLWADAKYGGTCSVTTTQSCDTDYQCDPGEYCNYTGGRIYIADKSSNNPYSSGFSLSNSNSNWEKIILGADTEADGKFCKNNFCLDYNTALGDWLAQDSNENVESFYSSAFPANTSEKSKISSTYNFDAIGSSETTPRPSRLVNSVQIDFESTNTIYAERFFTFKKNASNAQSGFRLALDATSEKEGNIVVNYTCNAILSGSAGTENFYEKGSFSIPITLNSNNVPLFESGSFNPTVLASHTNTASSNSFDISIPSFGNVMDFRFTSPIDTVWSCKTEELYLVE